MVWMLTRPYARDCDHGDDLFQQVWERVYETRGTFKSRSSFASWLSRVTTSVCGSDLRAEKARARLRQEFARLIVVRQARFDTPDPFSNLESIDRLSGRERQAIAQRIQRETDPAEMTGRMGTGGASIRSQIRHQTKRLRALIEGLGCDSSPVRTGD